MDIRNPEPPKRRDQSVYYQKWYSENAENVNLNRRGKYATDETYRESVKKRARDRKRKLLAMRAGRVVREYGGEKLFVYPIAWVCKETGVTSQYIRDNEDKGVIPSATFPGTRVYTEHQTKLLIKLLAELKAGTASAATRKLVFASWHKGL